MDLIENNTVNEILQKNLVPKEIEKNMYGEVFTPIDFICKMLDELPNSVWKDKSLKWFDPAVGIGNFPIVIYYKLMESLKSVIVGDKARSKHIIEKMLFMNELNKRNVVLCRKLFSNINPTANLNITCKDFLDYGDIKYDIIVGNPPYNESRIKETSDQPLYSKFIVKAIEMTSKLLFVVPSRWFSGGKGLDDFRKSMLSRKDIVSINHIANTKTIWPSVDIKGGVNYFFLDKEYNGLTKFNGEKIEMDKYDILVPYPNAYSLIDKVTKYPCISELYLSTGYFGITTNFKHFSNGEALRTNGEALRTNGEALRTNGEGEANQSLVKCYVSTKKGAIKYVHTKYIKNTYDFWKVFTPQGSGIGGDGFGNLIIGTPREIASQTYFSFRVESLSQAKSLKSYLETKFANYMLSLRKIDQHISENTLRWLPLPPLDREWTDAKVYKYYNLSNSDIKTIEMHNINTKKTRKHKVSFRNTRKNAK